MNTFVSAFSLLLSSLGSPDSNGVKEHAYFPAAKASCAVGITAFKNTVYPFIRNNCASCHDRPAVGPVQGPAHSVADIEISYQRVSSYMNFNDLDHSQFLIKGGNQHCLTYGVNCGITEANMKPVLQAWMDQGQKTCPPALKYVSSGISVPKDLPLPETNDWKRVQFDLSSIGDEYEGVFLDVEMQQFAVQNADHAGAYRFRKPRLATPDMAMKLKGIRFLVNGKLDPRETTFSGVDARIDNHAIRADKTASDFPILSTKNMIVLQDRDVGDVISVGFDVLEAVPNPSCKSLQAFTSNVMPILQKRSCFSCHGSGMQEGNDLAAVTALNLKGSTANVCSQFFQRVNWFDPDHLSPVIEIPLTGLFGHPRVMPYSREVFPAWTNWMKEEAKNVP